MAIILILSIKKISKEYARAVICVDDLHAFHYYADAIINHSEGISAADYKTEPYTKLYLGFDYALIRQPFLHLAQQCPVVNGLPNLFVCFGGSDSKNNIVSFLRKTDWTTNIFRLHLVLGPEYGRRAEVENYIRYHELPATIYQHLSAIDLANVMEKCGAAVCSPSTVCMEYLCTGGELFLYKIVSNQDGPYRNFIEKGIAKPVDAFDSSISPALLKKHFIDGKSGERLNLIAKHMYARL